MRSVSAIAADVTPRSAARAKSGRTTSSGPHQARRRGHVADAGDRAQLAFDALGVLVEHPAVLAGQHHDVLLAAAAEADLDARPGQHRQRVAQLAFDRLLADAAAVVAVRHLDRQRGLGHRGGAAAHERVVAGAAAAHRGVDQLHVLVLLHDLARRLGGGERLLEGAAGRQRHRDLGLAQVVGRDEAGGQQRHQREAADEEDHRGQHRQDAVPQAPRGPAAIDQQPARLVVFLLRRLQDVGRHHRRQHARHDQREEDRDRRRPAELHEELARNAGHEGGRQEHRDQREGGGDDRQTDLVGRFHRRLVRRLAHAQVAHDVLDLDDRIVDQDADHQRQAEQRDDVDREAEHVVHHGEGRDDRQRQRGGRHQRGAPVAQEEPDDDDGEDRALVQQVHRADVVLLHRLDEVEGLDELDVGVRLAQPGEFGLHAVVHVDLAGAERAHDLEADHAAAVEQRGAALLGHRVGHGGHLVQPHPPAVGQQHLDARQLVGRLHGGDRAHALLDAAHVGAAARRLLLDLAQLARDVGRRGVERQQLGRVELDAHLARHAADPRDGADAAHAQHRLGHVVVDEPAQALVVEPCRRHGVGQDRRAGQVHLADDRVAQVARQVAAHARHRVAHVVDRFLRGLLEPELDRDGGHAVAAPWCRCA